MRYRILIFSLLLNFLVQPSSIASGPKAGSACPAEGFTQTEKSITYVCKKVGKKLKWKKAGGASVKYDFTKTYSTDGGYLDNLMGGPCGEDPFVPTEWKEMQNFSIKYGGCGGQLRIAKYELGLKRPVTKYDPASKFSELSKCKISIDMDKTGLATNVHPWRKERSHPGPNSVIQLIPIYSEDSAKPINSPSKDYGKYLRFMKEWIDYSSDFGSDVQIRIPDQYIKFNGKIADYNLFHNAPWDAPNHVKFNNDVIATVDGLIDFKNATIGIVVAPSGTDAKVIQQAGIGAFQTNEGKVPVGFSQFGDIPTNPFASPYRGLTAPYWWLHESYHAGFGFDDRYGDMRRDINTEYGMGWWTLMTPWGGDLSVWEKWILGFVQDSQFQCHDGSNLTTHWIAPSSVRTKESKAVVIPISNTKAVVIESIRGGGLYYKHPREVHGVLVYDIDLQRIEHGMAMKLSLAKNRQTTSNQFFLSGAALKSGDYTEILGHKITILESGTFGDVVKVEKI